MTPDSVLLVGNSFVRGIKRPLKKIFKKSHNAKVPIKAHGPGIWTLEQHANSGRTAQLIQAKDWDFVFLQERSAGIGMGSYPFVETLHSIIDGNGSSTVMFMTWRDKGDPLEAYESLRGTPGGTYGYIPIAFQIGAPVAPVGWGVRNVVADEEPVELWRKGRHLNAQGRYLGALVVYATMTQLSPVGVVAPGGFSPTEVTYLQQIAHDTVLTDPAEWNIDD